MTDILGLIPAVLSSLAGNYLTQKDALDNAQRQAAAANGVLDTSLKKQQGFAGTNAATFGGAMDHYAPDAQAAQLAGAQGTRAATNEANISAPTMASPLPPGAPPAVGADLAKRMGVVDAYTHNNAAAKGALSGYGDAWFNNSLVNSQANRDIGVTNNFSNEEKSLLPQRQKLAETAAYKPPSIWGPLLSGTGSILGGYAGTQGGTAPSFASPANYNMTLPAGNFDGIS